MGKGSAGGESFQRWTEQKARNRGKAGRRRRCSPRRIPRREVWTADDAVCRDDDVASPTGYSTDDFERGEEQFIDDLEWPRVSRKRVKNAKPKSSLRGARGAPFAFQRRVERIDWRSLHSVDVDRLVRDVDIDTLEMVLDTIAFGDIQGEDTRSFTRADFVKIFRLAQLMVEYLLHVQELLAHHKSELLQNRTAMQQKNEKIRSRFLWQRNALLQTRHELKQATKTLQTYEVMLKIQSKHRAIQACQSNQQQVRRCSFCEKVFVSPYYLDLHVARKHQQKQEVTEDKILTLVSRAEETTAARVKEEMRSAVQAEIQRLRKRYQADLRRTETNSNTQVRTLQDELRQSNNQLHEVQTRLEVIQAQILCASSNNARLGSLYAPERPKGKGDGPNQEENSRLLEELTVAFTKVSDLQFAKRQSVFALETQVDDLRKENQHLKRTTTKVIDDKPDELNLKAYNQTPENPTMDPFLIFASRIHSSAPQPKMPRESFETQEDTLNTNRSIHIHKVPEPILAIIEAKEPAIRSSDVLDSQKLNDTTDLGLMEEPVALTPRERWTREPDEDQALLSLARPTSGRRGAQESEQESSACPEHSRHSTSAGKRPPCQEMKHETSSERMTKSYKERPKSGTVEKSKSREDESPTTVEEMRAKLEREMNAVHEEQERRQIAVQRLLAKELVKEKSEARKKTRTGTKIENTRSCKPAATQYSQTPKSETPRETIAPLVLASRNKEEISSPSSSTIHTLRKIVSNRAEIKRTQAFRPKPGPLGSTRTQPLRSPLPHQPGPGCKRSLPAFHPYIRPGLGNPHTQPRTSFHAAVLNSIAALKSVTHNQHPNNTAAPSKEHIIERLGAVTRELGKYFPPKNPSVEKAKCGTVKLVQPMILKLETETNETEEDNAEKRIAPHEPEKIQAVAEVAVSDFREVAPAMSVPEKQKWLSEHPSVSIPALPHVTVKYPHSETAFEEPHQEKANEFDGQLREELKKFGITSNTNGISDTTYNSISSALDMQRSLRMSQNHGKDRHIMEYQRGAVVWHTQRAIRDRDTAIIESQFDVATESGSDHLNDANGSENSAGESCRSYDSSITGHQSHKKDELDFEYREDELKSQRASHTRRSEQSSPQSSEISRNSDCLQEAESNCKHQVVSRGKHLSSSKVDGRECFSPRSRPHQGQVQHVSRAFALKPTQKQAKSSRNNRCRPPSRGELVRPTAEFVDSTWHPELDEEVEEEDLGLGDWDSDDDAVLSSRKQR